ncbi:DUF2567 domain-containing protein [Couchioplanes caeruleus]|uniref:Uncharacterized protein DUF2567 n=1 Tax=Couchioplanes caeruleus TaxID=56438 RepID=A0A3N1GFZ1_9ACTN|nr:DUF2567 domain-containing protein [Couchioplanes caeruleus]ROP29189.1 uncharacterized protein DUF2567 [Couchioplanes caeruleus]
MNPSPEPGPQPHEQQESVLPYGPEPELAGWAPPPPSRRPWRRTVGVAVLITSVMTVIGAPLGLLWSWLAPAVPVVNAGQNGIVVSDPSPEEYIAADGWFTIIGFSFGLLAAIVAWLVLRRDRGPGVLLGVTFGGLASALAMWGTGRLVGLSGWRDWQETSIAGDTYGRPPDLHTHGALLVAAFAAVIVTTLLAGWSNDPDLDRPGAKPGYGHDAGAEEDQAEPVPFSSGSPDAPDPTAAPAPPAPWPADPPRG